MIELFVAPIKGRDTYYLVIARGDDILLTHRNFISEDAARAYGREWIERNAADIAPSLNTDYAQLEALGRAKGGA